jgi:hypothetical protein
MHAAARLSYSMRRKTGRTGNLIDQKGAAQTGVFATILLFASQTVLITALLYYFGWVRTQANFGYFGVDTSLLAFGTADYVLRSINSAFPPLTGFALVALLLLAVDRWVVRAITAPGDSSAGKALTTVVSTAPPLGLLFATAVLIGLVFPGRIGRPLGLVLPLMLISAVGLLGYSGYLQSLRRGVLGRGQGDPDESSQTRTQSVVLVALGVLGVLWWLTLYAVQVGEREAVDSVATLQDQPEAIIYSSDRIALAGPGVVVDEIQQAGSKYRYRYSGLRLLIQTGTRYILVPVDWQKGRDSVFLVPGSDSVRLDIIGR